jgi:hypothetical protein
MNSEPSNGGFFNRVGVTIYVVAILGCFLIVAGLIWAMRHYTQPEPLGEARVQERRKNLAELRQTEAKQLTEYDWQDKSREIVRLPVITLDGRPARAMELTVQEWQNPAAARADLIARVTKATAPAPKPPEQPNKYE